MSQDLGGHQTNLQGLKGCQPYQHPKVTFPPAPSPKLPRTRGASPSPQPRTRPGPRARVAAATSLPFFSGQGGWTLPGSEEGTGEHGHYLGPEPGSGDLSKEGKAEKPSQRGWQEGRLLAARFPAAPGHQRHQPNSKRT